MTVISGVRVVNKNNNYTKENLKLKKGKNYAKFMIPSIIGIILFMFPIVNDGEVTIPIAILSNLVSGYIDSFIDYILIVLLTISFFGSLITVIIDKRFKVKETSSNEKKKGFWKSLFQVSPLWLIARGVAFVFGYIVLFAQDVTFIASADTGGLVFHDLLPVLFTIFFLAGILLPLLLNFGLLEFAGALLIKVMRPVFGLPGRAAIDAIASWLGDGTIGVLLTSKQYEEGFYTEREACVIGTNFSLVSITFSLVVINTVGLPHMFVPFYLTITLACIIVAILLPKIPPLSRKRDCFIDGTSKEDKEEMPMNTKCFTYGVEKALERVDGIKVGRSIFIDGFKNVIDMWIAVIPIVMAVGTIALLIAEYTPIFRILGLPFLPILNLLGVPEAVAASQTLFAGFADMLLPSVLIANVANDMTRFIVAAVSVCQLIYLSEVGALLIASKIPVSLKEIFLIFIERTLITLPIVVVIAKLIF
jgi:nucleoside recognition membrane protein YjiH